MGKRKWKLPLVFLFAGFVGFNALAWRHARALCRFEDVPLDRTRPPEELAGWSKVKVLLSGVTSPKPTSEATPATLGLPYEEVVLENTRGHRLEAWFVPGERNSPAVVLFHGYGACKGNLLPMARILHELGCPLLLVDFYGSGGSSGHTTTIGYLEAEDVATAANWIRQQQSAEKVVLYGISMGGAAVLRACAKLGVEVEAIMVESTFPFFRETIAKRFELMNLPATPAADFLLFWGAVEMGVDPWSHNPHDYARDIRCPSLVLTGARDKRVPLKSVEAMVANLAGPVSFHVYDSGHLPFAVSHPGLWRQHVTEFLRTL